MSKPSKRKTPGITICLWVFAFFVFITAFDYIKTDFANFAIGIVVSIALCYWGLHIKKKKAKILQTNTLKADTPIVQKIIVTKPVEIEKPQFVYKEVKTTEIENEPLKVDTPVVENIIVPKLVVTDKPQFEYKEVKVVGVTFKNGPKTRQAILRAIKWGDFEFEGKVDVTVEYYLFEDNDALGVYANGQQIGNLPADMIDWYIANLHRITPNIKLVVVGGGENKSGDKISFGARITFELRKVD